MMIKIVKILCVSLLSFLIASCASVVSKSNYAVDISSQPDGAEVVIADAVSGEVVYVGQTPTVVPLDTKQGYFKGRQYTVAFNKEGYETYHTDLTPGIDGWYFGNILLGGLIGMVIVDPITGAMWKLPNELNPELSPSETGDDALEVVAINQVPVELRSQLIALN